MEQERSKGEEMSKAKQKKNLKKKKGGVKRDVILKVPEWLLKLTTVK